MALRDAFRTATPVGDLGFLDLVPHVVGRRETGGRAGRAVDIDHATADAADQMMVVVADAVFESSRRPSGLDPPDQALRHQQHERVVDGLQRNRPNLRPDSVGHGIRRDVRPRRHRAKHREPLRRDLDAALPEVRDVEVAA